MKNKIRRFRTNNLPICFYCHEYIEDENKVTVDHKVAISRGGKDNKQNLVIACYDCNQKKGNMNVKEFHLFKKYKELLLKLEIEQLEFKKEMFKGILKEEHIKNGGYRSNLSRIVSRKLKALNSILKEKNGGHKKNSSNVRITSC